MSVFRNSRSCTATSSASTISAPRLRSSDHPPAALECEQLRLPVMLLCLVGFGTILAVLAMLLRTACSRCQVLLTPTATHAHTQPSLTAGYAPRAAGACLTLPFNHLTKRAKWLDFATACSRAGARAAR